MGWLTCYLDKIFLKTKTSDWVFKDKVFKRMTAEACLSSGHTDRLSQVLCAIVHPPSIDY